MCRTRRICVAGEDWDRRTRYSYASFANSEGWAGPGAPADGPDPG